MPCNKCYYADSCKFKSDLACEFYQPTNEEEESDMLSANGYQSNNDSCGSGFSVFDSVDDYLAYEAETNAAFGEGVGS